MGGESRAIISRTPCRHAIGILSLTIGIGTKIVPTRVQEGLLVDTVNPV